MRLLLVVAFASACGGNKSDAPEPTPPSAAAPAPAAAPVGPPKLQPLLDAARARVTTAAAKRTRALVAATSSLVPRSDLGACPIRVPVVESDDVMVNLAGNPDAADLPTDWRELREERMAVVRADQLATSTSKQLDKAAHALAQLEASSASESEIREPADLARSWELVIVATRKAAPHLIGSDKFAGGVVIGRAYLYSHRYGAVVCAADVAAESSETLSSAGAELDPYKLAADLENEAFRAAAKGLVRAGPKHGAAPELVEDPDLTLPLGSTLLAAAKESSAFVIDGDIAYISDGRQLERVALTGGEPKVIATEAAPIVDLVADKATLYDASGTASSAAIMAIPKAGGVRRVVAPLAGPAVGNRMLVQGSDLYITHVDASGGKLLRASGTKPAVVATWPAGVARALVVHGTDVLVASSDGEIDRVGANGLTQVAKRSGSFGELASNGHQLFWAATSDGDDGKCQVLVFDDPAGAPHAAAACLDHVYAADDRYAYGVGTIAGHEQHGIVAVAASGKAYMVYASDHVGRVALARGALVAAIGGIGLVRIPVRSN